MYIYYACLLLSAEYADIFDTVLYKICCNVKLVCNFPPAFVSYSKKVHCLKKNKNEKEKNESNFKNCALWKSKMQMIFFQYKSYKQF